MPDQEKTISCPSIIDIRRLAGLTGVSIAKLISSLMKYGVRATINESIDFETAAIVCQEHGIILTRLEKITSVKNTTGSLRPPVVTVMGHVDHGKTTLLDHIKKTDVVSGESGGITQHIAAYQVELKVSGKKHQITFLDTPGHEAFSMLRSHGARITDIVVLVVAADDGVKPQTLEAISHAKAANVPVIVAINKVDAVGADPEKVKRELTTHGLSPEEWGGDTPMVEVSAKTGKGINELLELIILVAAMAELKSALDCPPTGVVVDAQIETGAGPVATILVKSGILKVGEIVVVGSTWGKIKFMRDWHGQRVSDAHPSTPVVISGLHAIPSFGDELEVASDEKTARERLTKISRPGTVKSISQVENLERKRLNLIVKADVNGSLEALKQQINSLKNNDIEVIVLASGVGPVSETDLSLALTAHAYIVNFNQPLGAKLKKAIQERAVKIISSDVIYRVVEQVTQIIQDLVEPEIVEKIIAKLRLLAVFRADANEAIIGGEVKSGTVKPNQKAHLYRGEEKVTTVKIKSIKIGKADVNEAKKGEQCGLNIIRTSDEALPKFLPQDELQIYTLEKKSKSINFSE